ncbi:HECT-domain (ubiquitin-transferase), putative [Angomonas deanei]|uniref:HECT-domain (Ubiquitin-transferase), putative n=1 Tax=Angomonas deanei TaxID=59799 RepID=A0A7G2C988_9TRYP|nr:HECT-domain (ubiquitin-transferase), putative [Angomonas deanei]
MQVYESQQKAHPHESNKFHLPHSKKRVWRDKPLECLEALLGGQRPSGTPVWDFEYYNEPGTGLGPTRQFYSSVGEALRSTKLNLWLKSEDDTAEKFNSRYGLYPKLWDATTHATEVAGQAGKFRTIGRVIGRAILDGHTVSLSFSTPLLKLLRGDVCGVNDIESIAKEVGDVLSAISDAKRTNQNEVLLSNSKKACRVEDLGLTFCVPGEGSIELTEGGSEKDVTFDNCMEYCDGVVTHMLSTNVDQAVKALRRGIDDYVPLVSFKMLTVEELHEVINGRETALTLEDLSANCNAAHGFTLTCKHMVWFFEILASFSLTDQKAFILFLTGSPTLPLGGLESLKPKITIVRKYASEPNIKEEDQLPSAMTCQNYLKLPAYESKEQMEQKLRLAMNEGSGAFLLT